MPSFEPTLPAFPVISINKPLSWAMISILALSGCDGGSGGSTSIAFTEQDEDPVVLEIPIAYVKRSLPEELDDFSYDLRDPLAYNPGAQLFIRDIASNLADEIDVTPDILAIVADDLGENVEDLTIDIKDLETSYDGDTLIFAARIVPEPVDNNLEETSWNLWTYQFSTGFVDYVMPSALTRNEGIEAGLSQDIAPYFLPDDRIVFSSTRQVASQAKQLNEGRGQLFAALEEGRDTHAAVLHTYDPETNEIEQISFNQSHDLDPTVLSSGEILFSRWNQAPGNNQISLHRLNPDGLHSSYLYGHHSADSVTDGVNAQWSQPRELQDGRIAVLARTNEPDSLGGNIILLDTENYVENDQTTWGNSPSGNAQTTLTSAEILIDQSLSAGGQFAAHYPLHDGTNRLLVSWSPCRVVEGDVGEEQILPCSLGQPDSPAATPLYGLWVYNPADETQQIVVSAEEGKMISEVVAGEPRDFPPLTNNANYFDSQLAAEDSGLLVIDSFYDFDGLDSSISGIAAHANPDNVDYTERPLRFVRVIQPVPIPDDEVREIPNYAFGVSNQAMREILGYSVIEPDGSVVVKVPAETPFMISGLDKNGRRIGERHNHWLQLGAGEILHCTGCHTSNSELPHGRLDSQPASSNPGAQALSTGTLGFLNTRSDLFATEVGQSMAEVFDLRRPESNETQTARTLSLHPTYTDEWSDIADGITPDDDIDLSYEDWTDIADDKPIIVANLDPLLPSRIVINYIDHIQPIWERTRTAIDDGEGNMIDSRAACHTTDNNTSVPAGQLDLTSASSDIDPDQYRSYRELLSNDSEQWFNAAVQVADRQRSCDITDDDGNQLTEITTFNVRPSMSRNGANSSNGFFGCFESGPASCGLFNQDTSLPPSNCIDNGTQVIDDPVDHTGILSAAELRLISEWLDIGAQYYNNPFDTRLDP